MTSWSVDKLDINHTTDQSFLPYTVREIHGTHWDADRKPISAPVQVYATKSGDSGSAIITNAKNAHLNRDDPSIITLWNLTNETTISETSLYGTMTDYCYYTDAPTGGRGIVATYYWRDSAFVVRQLPGISKLDTLFLTSGRDRTGDGAWRPNITVQAVKDYDVDGKDEVFIHVFTGRDMTPRILFCIEAATMQVEWSLPFSPAFVTAANFCCHTDSTRPSVTFVSYGPRNSVKYANFDDAYGYFTKVDCDGNIVFNWIIAKNYDNPHLRRLPDQDSLFLLYHPLPLTRPGAVDTTLVPVPRLSIVRDDGTIVRSIPVQDAINSIWYGNYNSDEEERIFTISRAGIVRVYDTDLDIIAESGRSPLREFLGTIQLGDQNGPSLVFSDNAGVSIYSDRLEQLAAIETVGPSSRCQPVEFDSLGNVTQFLLTGTNSYFIGAIAEKAFADYSKILFTKYRMYILACLSALLAGLLISNYYRRKTKDNLQLIASQKQDLEQTHLELERAQEGIIKQEKYKQAQDIAGGFAHEIRNSLFPALTNLQRIEKIAGEPDIDREKLDNAASRITRAVTKAIGVTKLISQFTRLDAELTPEPVSVASAVKEVLEDNRDRIDQQQVKVTVEGLESVAIESNYSQFNMVLNNLVLNSLDALRNRPNPSLSLCWTSETGCLRLTVIDNGSGISSENLDKVFDTFFSTKPNSGTGIGLPMVKRILDLYDGQVSISSEIDKGTTVELTLRITDSTV